MLSHASVKSYWVDREVQFARAEGKRVIPIRIDDSKLPGSFDGRDVIELRQGRGDKRKIAPSRILRHSPQRLFGREEWLAALDAAWAARDRVRVYSLIAWGGAGKTSVVAHWVLERLVTHGWPGVERYFDWSFYSQGVREQSQASADFFIAAALTFFGDPEPQAGSPWDRGARLARLVARHRTLLVLDGIEPLQYPPNSPQAGEFKDEALAALLQGLAMDSPGLCVVTSHEPLKTLQTFIPGGTVQEQHLNKLPKQAAIALLRHLRVVGTEEELVDTWEDVAGHALTLQLLGRYLADAHAGDIRRRQEVHLVHADRETGGRTAMKVLAAYEKWLKSAGPDRQRDLAVLRLTGLFDRPATPDCLAALRAAPAISGLTDAIVPLTDVQWRLALADLEKLELITLLQTEGTSSFAIDAHPLVREYFAEQLKTTLSGAFTAAHSRLFDHLCKTTPHRPDDLPGLQPLYQAVAHGCLAGRYNLALHNVYRDRILRGTGSSGFYSSKKLGAFGAELGAMAAFFQVPWSRPYGTLSVPDQAWLFNQAALRLQALGRLSEALDPAREGMQRRVETDSWHQAAISAGNLSVLEVTLGLLVDGVLDGRRGIKAAEQAGDAFLKMGSRAIAADALHQAGRRTEAQELFVEAEGIQARRESRRPLLYSIAGFFYADLLQSPAERVAWQAATKIASGLTATSNNALAWNSAGIFPSALVVGQALAACDESTRRAAHSLKVVTSEKWLLDIAHDHLLKARAALYRALLTSATPNTLPTAIAIALSKLRDANTLNHLPTALLTAAFYAATLGGEPEEAKRYLNEAQLIAERGPMPLYLADVHLHRARLFGALKARGTMDYPWESPEHDLKEARRLIEKHGYWRRKEELEDAEAAFASDRKP